MSYSDKFDRRELLFEAVFKRRNIDSSFKYNPEQTALQVASAEEHLTNLGVFPDKYKELYEIATLIHAEQNSPFNVDTLIRAAIKLKENKNKIKAFKSVKIQSCGFCKGTGFELKGLVPILENGKRKKCRCTIS